MKQTKEKTGEEFLVSQVLRLQDLVEYQTDAIVSKTILDKKAGTVTLFAFDKGQGLSEHTAPYDAFVHVIDGNADLTISSKRYSIRAGEMIIMPANKPHAVKAKEKFKMLLIMIHS